MWNLEQVGFELRQLPGAVHGVGIDQERRQHLGVAMLAGVQVEHEVHQRALQPRAQVPIDGEARAGQLGGALQVEDAQLLAQLPVRLGREVELRRRAPAAHFDVVRFGLADRNAVVGKIGDAGQDVAQSCVRLLGNLLGFRDLLAQLLGLD